MSRVEQIRISRRAERARRLWASAFNLPNQLTTARLVLSVIMFGVIAAEHYLAGMVLFIIAAGTDYFDGYFARKWNQVTNLGRILDPFADKVIVCGTFIFVMAVEMMQKTPWGLRAWMVVVIVGRELLVTALRSFIEDKGGDFSAKMSGKLKMVLQCVAAGACLFYVDYGEPACVPGWVWWGMVLSLWSAVALTVYSGFVYILVAARLVRGGR